MDTQWSHHNTLTELGFIQIWRIWGGLPHNRTDIRDGVWPRLFFTF